MICIYHSKDLDGYASGAIVKLKYPDAIMVGYDYGQPISFEEFIGQDVIMIDVSWPMKDMFKLATLCNLTWIDHHASAINDFHKWSMEDGCGIPITAVLEVGKAACEIGWKYLFPEVQMPHAIEMLGQYDTWRNEEKEYWSKIILPFQYGMRSICTSPETFPTQLLVPDDDWNEELQIITTAGIGILSYIKSSNSVYCRSAFEIEFEGLRAICLNTNGFSSQTFESVYDESKHDVMIPFAYSGKFWKFSMYTTKDIDLSVIAKRLGGGGHKQACGFEKEGLPVAFGGTYYQ